MTADYIMVGGFLGAGKTTAVLRLAGHLAAQGRRLGVITNDQSQGLVDTSMVQSHGYPTQEITGGCFCCRFTSLTDAAERLTRQARPDAFIAEPVGSCTDLRATVQYPLRRLYGDDYRVAPLTVLVDPIRAARVLGLEPGRTFSAKVQYIYEKQLEEAEIIAINKSDLIDGDRQSALIRALNRRFPDADVIVMSARTGQGLDAWFARVCGSVESVVRAAMDVDYDRYAEGEALLGWLNATCRVASATPFDGNEWLARLGHVVHGCLFEAAAEIAHFKMTLSPESGHDLAVLNIVQSDGRAESVHHLQDDVTAAELIVNLRAEADPDLLHAIVRAGLEEVARASGVHVSIAHSEHFRPGRPTPTHRMVAP